MLRPVNAPLPPTSRASEAISKLFRMRVSTASVRSATSEATSVGKTDRLYAVCSEVAKTPGFCHVSSSHRRMGLTCLPRPSRTSASICSMTRPRPASTAGRCASIMGSADSGIGPAESPFGSSSFAVPPLRSASARVSLAERIGGRPISASVRAASASARSPRSLTAPRDEPSPSRSPSWTSSRRASVTKRLALRTRSAARCSRERRDSDVASAACG